MDAQIIFDNVRAGGAKRQEVGCARKGIEGQEERALHKKQI